MSGVDTVLRGLGVTRLCLIAVCCCLLCLEGCGSRHGGTGEGIFRPTKPDAGLPSLTDTEKAILHSRGQIDGSIPHDAMENVTRQYAYLLRQGRSSMNASAKRAEQFLSYSRRVFRSRGMPEDLAYLAIVESGYRRAVRSQAGAAGAWQFMPYTGKNYGLVQDWWTDERLDFFKSTEAAADYLQKLYGDFGDWSTAIAAYNAGEGKLSRAMRETGGRNFHELNSRNHMLDEKTQLREETRQYVPRFIAVLKIMRNLPQLGFDPIDLDAVPATQRLMAKPGTDLRGLARACRMSWNEFMGANPHHRRSVTDTGRTTFVYVPSAYANAATTYMETPQATVCAGWTPRAVESSADSWSKISRRGGVSVEALRVANAESPALRVGETVVVPGSVDMSAAAVAAEDKKQNRTSTVNTKGKEAMPRRPVVQAQPSADNSGQSHVLKEGETLTGVAQRYSIDLQELQKLNGIDNPDVVRAGTALKIPESDAGPRAPDKQLSTKPDGKNTAKEQVKPKGKV